MFIKIIIINSDTISSLLEKRYFIFSFSLLSFPKMSEYLYLCFSVIQIISGIQIKHDPIRNNG